MITRSTYKPHKFDDIAINIVERAMPQPEDQKTYIGLEHMDTGSLHISRWGSETELIGEKLRINKGDVLFARRNAYLKRVAVAPFDGLFSAHGMVLRPKIDVILPELFPFFLFSDYFLDRAIKISVGSLSPTVNWKTLKQEVFNIPPIDEQKRIAELLWVADDALEKHRVLLENARKCLNLALTEIFDKLTDGEKQIEFSKVGDWRSGGTPSRKVVEYWNGRIPWVSPKDMKTEQICDSIEKITDKAVTDAVAGAKLLPAETIVFVVRGMILVHTFPVAITKCPVAINQDMKAIFVSKDFDPLYVFYWLKYKSSHILKMTEESSHGTKRLATEMLGKLMIPLVSIEHQKEIVSKFETITHVIQDSELHIEQTTILRKNLCNKLIGGVSDV